MRERNYLILRPRKNPTTNNTIPVNKPSNGNSQPWELGEGTGGTGLGVGEIEGVGTGLTLGLGEGEGDGVGASTSKYIAVSAI